MKKKMSKSQFAEWGDYAIELRTKVADGELEIEEYQRLIKLYRLLITRIFRFHDNGDMAEL